MFENRCPISFIATDRPDESVRFYAKLLGLSLIERSQFALVFDDAGVMLRIQIVPSMTPAAFTAHGWRTDDIAADIQDLRDKGIEFLTFDHVPQDDFGIWTTPDGSKIAWFHDPCGNILSLTQF